MNNFSPDMLILTLIILLVGFLTARFSVKGRKRKGVRIADTPTVVESIKSIAEMATACYFEEKIILEKKPNPLVDNKMGELLGKAANKEPLLEDELCLIAKGHVRAGYNLKEMTEQDIVLEGGVLTITLPKVRILDVIINPKGWDFYVESGDWRERIKDIQSTARQLIEQDAISSGILKKAAGNGETKIKAIMHGLGYQNVEVKQSL